MRVKRRTFLKAASSFFATAALADIPNAPTNLMIEGGSVGGDSTLAELAASMSAGQWAQLTSVLNQNSVIGSQSGSSGSLIGYANTGAWNPFNSSIEILGSDHHGATPSMEHVRYASATNAFLVVHSAPVVPNIGHAYDHTTVNPYNGDIYHTRYSGFSGSIPVHRKIFGAGSFSSLTSLSASDQVSHGSAWWSGSFDGAGAHGCLVVYDCGNISGQLRCYDPLSDSVIYSNDSAAPGSSGASYHVVLEYSDVKNVAVYGGGEFGNENKLWRLEPGGSITAMPTSPVPVGIQLGNFVADPVTGNFLLMSQDQLWELNPDGAGTWTRQTAGRAPPTSIGNPQNGIDHVISCSIPDYGIITYIKQQDSTDGAFWVYKHA